MYAAYLQIDGQRIRVFPRGRKTSFFKSIKTAARQLERKAPDVNCRGLVYERGTKDLVWTIAL